MQILIYINMYILYMQVFTYENINVFRNTSSAYMGIYAYLNTRMQIFSNLRYIHI